MDRFSRGTPSRLSAGSIAAWGMMSDVFDICNWTNVIPFLVFASRRSSLKMWTLLKHPDSFVYKILLSVGKGNSLSQPMINYSPVYTAGEGGNCDVPIIFNCVTVLSRFRNKRCPVQITCVWLRSANRPSWKESYSISDRGSHYVFLHYTIRPGGCVLLKATDALFYLSGGNSIKVRHYFVVQLAALNWRE